MVASQSSEKQFMTLSALVLLLNLASPLKLTLVSIILNITSSNSPGYICDPSSIFTFNNVGSLTPYWNLDSDAIFFLKSTYRGGNFY